MAQTCLEAMSFCRAFQLEPGDESSKSHGDCLFDPSNKKNERKTYENYENRMTCFMLPDQLALPFSIATDSTAFILGVFC